jgi:hypothetical protein
VAYQKSFPSKIQKWHHGDIGSTGVASHWQKWTIGSIGIKNHCGLGQKIVDGGFPEKRRPGKIVEKSARGRGQWKKHRYLVWAKIKKTISVGSKIPGV